MTQDELNNPMAFPRPASVGTNYATGEEGVVVDPQKGMSLRDYFAAKAMQGIKSNPDHADSTSFNYPALAEEAYKIADAMLKQRSA